MREPRINVKRISGRGFTIIEIVVVLAVLSLIAAMLVPLAFQLFTAEQASAVENELQTIYTAIVGNAEKGIYGYAGDVGTYPRTLMDLVRQPESSPGVPLLGWKGPYVQNARIENGVWIDPFGRPYEYYLASGATLDGQVVPDQVAIVSRGPDGRSTNTSTTPNDSMTWFELGPAEIDYAKKPYNADNVVFPRAGDDGKALNVKVDGDLALNILNWDNNKEVNAFVPACPELYTVTATSVVRGMVEANFRFVQALAFNLSQGQYALTISPQGLTTTSWAETLTIQPGSTLTRTLNLTGLDSSGTPLFTLTVKNGFINTKLEVYEFDTKLKATDNKSFLDEGETKVFTPHGCAQVYIRKKDKSEVVDQFVMPYGHFTRVEGALAATLVVTNFHGHPHVVLPNGKLKHVNDDHHHHHHGHHRVFVYRDGILLGTVNHHQTKTFKDLYAGNMITIYSRDNVLLYAPTPLGVGTNTVKVSG